MVSRQSSLWGLNMDTVREFLETSTIHGLSHISKAESKLGKIAWTIIICTSFISAGYLISVSYKDWSESPVSATISTHPIATLPFPKVTVCPPKGTNTALNYDLIHQNKTFTEDQKQKLEEAVQLAFFNDDNSKFAEKCLDVTNQENIDQLYDGFQTVPTILGKHGFEVRMTGSEGQISSPGYGGQTGAQTENELEYIHYILEFPDNLVDLMGGTGSLVVDIEVETKSEGQVLEYRLGPRYKFYNPGDSKNSDFVWANTDWDEAEAQCVTMGGHLAAITSDEEKAELSNAIPDVKGGNLKFWLGGKRMEKGGNWTWVNGKEWKYEDWLTKLSSVEGDYECLQFNQEESTSMYGAWTYIGCRTDDFFVCEYEPDDQIRGTRSKTLTYSIEDLLHHESFHFWWKSTKTQENYNKDEKVGGFNLKWRILNKFPNLIFKTSHLGGEISTPYLGEEHDKELYLADRKSTFQLTLPEAAYVGKNKLNIQIEVSIGEGDGWNEVVEYREGPTFTYHSCRQNFEQAEATCVKNGGHLASVTTAYENEEVKALSQGYEMWLGAICNSTQHTWSWLDVRKWMFEDWMDGQVPTEKYESMVMGYTSATSDQQRWQVKNPQAWFPFVCRPEKKVFTRGGIYRLEYLTSELPNGIFSIIWQYRFQGMDILGGWNKSVRTGFKLSWNLTDEASELVTYNLNAAQEDEHWKHEAEAKALYKEENTDLVLMASMVEHAQREELISHC